jgi:hypothetical protein
MDMQSCLEPANYAKKDNSLIPNHTLNGVDSNIRRHLKESKELLELVREYPRYVDSLEKDICALSNALAVYE